MLVCFSKCPFVEWFTVLKCLQFRFRMPSNTCKYYKCLPKFIENIKRPIFAEVMIVVFVYQIGFISLVSVGSFRWYPMHTVQTFWISDFPTQPKIVHWDHFCESMPWILLQHGRKEILHLILPCLRWKRIILILLVDPMQSRPSFDQRKTIRWHHKSMENNTRFFVGVVVVVVVTGYNLI